MKLGSRDGAGSLSLRIRQASDFDVHASIRATGRGFQGVNSSVYYFRADFDAFLASLDEFSRQQLGEVRLNSMSPGEGTIRVFQLGGARHLGIQVHISRIHYVQDRSAKDHVSITWGLDPSHIVRLAGALRDELNESLGRQA